MNNPNFRKTGKNIEVPLPDMIQYVKQQLENYQDGSPGLNPFEQPIIYTLPDGRQVQVPEDIKKQAINDYKKSNYSIRPDPSFAPFNEKFNQQELIEEMPLVEPEKKVVKQREKKDDNDKDNSIYLFLLVLAVLIGIFCYYKNKN